MTSTVAAGLCSDQNLKGDAESDKHYDQIRGAWSLDQWEGKGSLCPSISSRLLCNIRGWIKGDDDNNDADLPVDRRALQRTMWKRILYFNWTTQWLNILFVFYSLWICTLSNDCMPLFSESCYLDGILLFSVNIGTALWLCLVSVNVLLFILKNTPVN